MEGGFVFDDKWLTPPERQVFYNIWPLITDYVNGVTAMPKRGDRVRIKEGYDGAGRVAYYIGKSMINAGIVWVGATEDDARSDIVDGYTILADAIEPYPYTREERIERAIEDYDALLPDDEFTPLDDEARALLFAILDAGV